MSKSIIAIADAGRRRPENVFGETDATRLAGRLSPQSATGRDPALNYLRAFITVLVVAHHSVLAYARISPNTASRDPLHPGSPASPLPTALAWLVSTCSPFSTTPSSCR